MLHEPCATHACDRMGGVGSPFSRVALWANTNSRAPTAMLGRVLNVSIRAAEGSSRRRRARKTANQSPFKHSVLGSARTVDEGQHADFICAFVHAHAHLNLPGVAGSAGVVVLLAAAIHCRMLRILTKGAGVRVDPARHPPWPTDVPTCACIGKFEGRIAVTILVCLRCVRGRQSQAVWHVTVVNSHS